VESAKAVLEALRGKEWPGATNDMLDEISVSLLRGDVKRAVAAIRQSA
jgi:hypothetical protein